MNILLNLLTIASISQNALAMPPHYCGFQTCRTNADCSTDPTIVFCHVDKQLCCQFAANVTGTETHTRISSPANSEGRWEWESTTGETQGSQKEHEDFGAPATTGTNDWDHHKHDKASKVPRPNYDPNMPHIMPEPEGHIRPVEDYKKQMPDTLPGHPKYDPNMPPILPILPLKYDPNMPHTLPIQPPKYDPNMAHILPIQLPNFDPNMPHILPIQLPKYDPNVPDILPIQPPKYDPNMPHILPIEPVAHIQPVVIPPRYGYNIPEPEGRGLPLPSDLSAHIQPVPSQGRGQSSNQGTFSAHKGTTQNDVNFGHSDLYLGRNHANQEIPHPSSGPLTAGRDIDSFGSNHLIHGNKVDSNSHGYNSAIANEKTSKQSQDDSFEGNNWVLESGPHLPSTADHAPEPVTIRPRDFEEACGSKAGLVYPDRGFGDGSMNMTRFYYDKQFHMCLAFTYTGRGGNQNNFEQQQQCLEDCVYAIPDLISCEGSNNGCRGVEDDICREGEFCQPLPPMFNFGKCCNLRAGENIREALDGKCPFGKGDGKRISRSCNTMQCMNDNENCVMINERFGICCPTEMENQPNDNPYNLL